MATKFKIMEDSQIFKSNYDHYPIDYRLYLCFLIFKKKSTDCEILEALKDVELFMTKYERSNNPDEIYVQNPSNYIKGYMDIYAIKTRKTNNIGFTIIDKTESCYPLVCFPKNPEKGNRVYAFRKSVTSVLDSYDGILKIIMAKKNWDYCKDELDDLLKQTKSSKSDSDRYSKVIESTKKTFLRVV